MKSFRFDILLLLPVILFTSCGEDEIRDREKVNLTFNFSLQDNKSVQLPSGASALISVETSNGEAVVDQEEVDIQMGANGYITGVLQLPQGAYRLVDFMVVNESGEILYATPRQKSTLASQVAQPLPFNFTVKSNEAFHNRLALLSTQSKAATDFGYNTFKRQAGLLKIQVYLNKDNSLFPTTAEAFILKGLDTLSAYQLSDKMNIISFTGDPAETYSLVVAKDSYSRFSQDFTMQQVKGKPVKAILEPALTVVGVPIADQNYFAMQLDPAWDIFDFDVDWGDGTNQTWTSGVTTILDHYYPEPGQYFISITGHGLDSVVLVGNLTGAGAIARLGMEHLVNLRDFRIEYGIGPKVIDLSACKLLNEIRIYPHPLEQSPVEDIIIANDAAIYNMEIPGNRNLKPESLNELINDIHHQVVNSPRSGDFYYSTWEDANVPAVTPSAEALEKLRDLKNTYHWFVAPDPDGVPL